MGLELVYAIHPFEAENDDEIAFEFGEPITVLEKDEMYGDGWWQGENIHGKIGLFPMTYTSYINPLTSSETEKDETIDDIHDKLQKMGIKNEENDQFQIESIELQQSQLQALSSKNVRNGKLLISPSSGSNSSNNSSRISSLRRSQRQSSENNTNKFGSHSSSSQIQIGPVAPSPTELIISAPTELIVSSSSETIENSQAEFDSSTINNFEYHPLNWDVRKVCSWLEEKGFKNEITNFIENDITGDVLLQLDLYTLKELNINSFGKRMHIMNAINELKSQFSMAEEPGPDDDVSDIEERSERVISPVARSEPCQIYPQNLGYNNYLTSSNIASMNKVGDLNHEYLRNDVDNLKNIKNNYTFPSYFSNPLKLDFAEDSNIDIVNKKSRKIFPKWNNSSTENQTGVFKRYSGSNERRNTSGKQIGKEQTTENLIYINEEIMGAIGEPDYEGWLKKQGTKYKTWKSRYCILKGADFYYFKSNKDVNSPKIKGHIDLTGYRIIPDENILHGKYGFKLTHNSMRTHYFAHEDVEKMRGWMKAMMKATILRNNEAPVISSSNINTVSLVEAFQMAPRPPQPRRPSISAVASLAKISSTPTSYTKSSTMGPLEPLVKNKIISPKIRPQINNNKKF
ncbi:3470_t:CDS:10 [Diversispora eburnea]|uniref:3470_t:CDS:1 n=1 Tax=Diversispora eburnea TaxID=1213867 RepID=A0A9N8W1U6_9GLOM|nr:3470_t:CDS:10 [Diversispora eburnea]